MVEADLSTTLTPARRRIAFYLLLLGAFMPSFNMFVVTIALPVIRDALAASASEASLVVSAYTSAYAVCLITGGRLGDLYGRRLMFLIGMAGFVATSLMCGLAPSIALLVGARVLQGMFAALMAPPVLAGIRTLFSPEEIPWALNVYGTGIGVAVAGGQFLGGMLISLDAWGLGWRLAFLVNLPIGIVALAVVPFLVPESGSRERPRMDYGGVLLLSAALASFIVPLSIGRGEHWAPWVLALLAASLPLLGAFLAFERRLARRGGMPILDAALLQIGSFRRGLVVAFLFFFTAPFYVFFSLYLQAGLSRTPLAAGLAVLPYGIANFLGPMLATRFPAAARPYLFGVGMALELLGYGGIALCAALQIGGWAIFIVIFTAGFGQGIAMPEMINAILGEVPRNHTGLAAGMMNSTLQIGSSISVPAIGSIFFAMLGDGTTPADYGHALGVAIGSQIAVLGLSMLLGLRNGRRSVRDGGRAAADAAPRRAGR
ncbi:MAG TPA: MFS transporter [Stellaceae bacterium]|nr:MFS transporter [Stellaceae bacterium]